MPIQTLALILLIGHLGSVAFITFVIQRQIDLFKLNINPELLRFRRTLFYLSLAILAGNFIPISIDGLTLFVDIGRPEHVKAASIIYALSNAIIKLLSTYLVWRLYQLAAEKKV